MDRDAHGHDPERVAAKDRCGDRVTARTADLRWQQDGRIVTVSIDDLDSANPIVRAAATDSRQRVRGE
jgi:hypothetical protein